VDAQGRRRFRDVEWKRADGRLVIGEIDGVGHMEAGRWYDDVMRDAELAHVEVGAIRFRPPSLACRAEEPRVVDILRTLLLKEDLSARRGPRPPREADRSLQQRGVRATRAYLAAWG
jgi:hypothetical protein